MYMVCKGTHCNLHAALCTASCTCSNSVSLYINTAAVVAVVASLLWHSSIFVTHCDFYWNTTGVYLIAVYLLLMHASQEVCKVRMKTHTLFCLDPCADASICSANYVP